jgi:peptidoglycan/xylan/chitin deacetylase (PgdA/CDA1 family)
MFDRDEFSVVRTSRKLLKLVFIHLTKHHLGSITHVRTRERVAAITLDDGPDAETTPAFLELLERNQARGTFFVVGENASRHPDILRRMNAAGHAVGNHSWDHSSFTKISGTERRALMRGCEKAIGPYSQGLFRPPYGDQSYASRLDALRMGFKVIFWNLVAEDWRSVEPQETAKRLAQGIHPGSILLFHDTLFTVSEEAPRDRYLSLKILEILFQELSGRFQFITVPELLRRGSPCYAHWFQENTTDYLNRLQGTQGRKARRYAGR